MSVDYTRTPGADAPEDSESAMFAPTPVWDRGRKNRGKARAMFDESPDTEPVRDTVRRDEMAAGGMAATDMAASDRAATDMAARDEVTRETAMSPNADDAAFVAPMASTTRRRGSVAPAAIGVGLIALAALAAAGWYATRPADQAMTPGSTAPATSIATAPAVATPDTALAVNTPPADAASAASSATPGSTTTTTTTHHVTASTGRAAMAAATPAPTVRRRSTHAAMAASPERSVTARGADSTGVDTGTRSSLGAVNPTPPTVTLPPTTTTPTSPPVSATPTPAPAPATTTPDVSSPATSSSSTATPQ